MAYLRGEVDLMSGCCGGKAAESVLGAMDVQSRCMTPEEAEKIWPLERQGEGATATDRFEAEAYVIPSEASYVPATEHVWLEVPTSADRIKAASGRVLDLLLSKNESYGDTALNPLRILSKLDAYEGLAVRADDKLSRLKNAPDAFQEDALLDLAGYLILMLAARGER